MFKKPTPLDPKKHAHLRLLPTSDYAFARGELLAPVIIDELADVAREYPIVFPKSSPLPVAMLGVTQGANAYVGATGQWLARYIPASIRHYPMTIRRIPAQPKEAGKEAAQAAQGQFAVLLDMESPCVSETHGDPVFDDAGQPGALAQQKMKILNLMQSRAGVTRRLVKAIEAAGLLTERVIKVKSSGGEERSVAGVRVIDEKALNQLDDVAFNKLRATGALPLVYASLLSWANFRQGPIGKSHPLPSTAAAAPAVMADDVIRF
jgi:SapC